MLEATKNVQLKKFMITYISMMDDNLVIFKNI